MNTPTSWPFFTEDISCFGDCGYFLETVQTRIDTDIQTVSEETSSWSSAGGCQLICQLTNLHKRDGKILSVSFRGAGSWILLPLGRAMLAHLFPVFMLS